MSGAIRLPFVVPLTVKLLSVYLVLPHMAAEDYIGILIEEVGSEGEESRQYRILQNPYAANSFAARCTTQISALAPDVHCPCCTSYMLVGVQENCFIAICSVTH